MSKRKIISEIGGRKIKLSNLDKVLYPGVQVTKAAIMQYYIQVAEYMLPFLKQRPLTLIRYPDGITANKFYSKNRPSYTPSWVGKVRVTADDDNTYSMASDVASLAWMASMATLEYHTMTVRASTPTMPDHFIFDLDPSEEVSFDELKELAADLRLYLQRYGYKPFLKTSGGKGLHIYVPILPQYEQSVVMESIRTLAQGYVKINTSTTLQMKKGRRKGKVLLDIYRNGRSQTCVAPYSTRGRAGCPVSTPLYWDELPSIKYSGQYSIDTVLEKVQTDGIPWATFRSDATPLGQEPGAQPVAVAKPVVGVGQPVPSLSEKTAIEPVDIATISLKPMLASAATKVPSAGDFAFEIKWDGIRVVAVKDQDHVSLWSRNGNELTDKFPRIVEALAKLAVQSMIADGEVVALDSAGRPHFGKTVGRMHKSGERAIAAAAATTKTVLYLFDCMYVEGADVRGQPLEARRARLAANIAVTDHLRYSESFEDGLQLLAAVKAQSMEGIMCKRKGSLYLSDSRSKDWLKVKISDTAVAHVIGYTAGKGDRQGIFGSLHLAQYIDDAWIYRGRVGSGFDAKKLAAIYQVLQAIESGPKLVTTAVDEEYRTTWIQPSITAKIRYASMTDGGVYREPVFIELIPAS